MAEQDTSLNAKIILLGSSGVGKTSIICQAVSHEFDPEIPATAGACYTPMLVKSSNININLQIWDTAGQERFRAFAPMFFRGSIVALLVFSIIDDTSLEDVRRWGEEIKQQFEEMPALFVIGNKCDLYDSRKISSDQAESVAKELNAQFIEVSAKTREGIDELFSSIAEQSLNILRADATKPEVMQARRSSIVLKPEKGAKVKRDCNC
jgi:small GTP-binding protein